MSEVLKGAAIDGLKTCSKSMEDLKKLVDMANDAQVKVLDSVAFDELDAHMYGKCLRACNDSHVAIKALYKHCEELEALIKNDLMYDDTVLRALMSELGIHKSNSKEED